MSDTPFSRQPSLWARARFRTALSALPPEQRTLFVERLRGGLELGELAHALGLDVRRARQALFHAMRQMREDLAEAADGDDDAAWLGRCRVLVEDESVVADLVPARQWSALAEPPAAAVAAPPQDVPWLFPGLEVVTREMPAVTEADVAAALAAPAPDAAPEPAADANAQTPAAETFVDPATLYVPQKPFALPSAPPRARPGGKIAAVIALLALAGVLALWLRPSAAPDQGASGTAAPAASAALPSVAPAPALPPPLTSADLPMLALELSEPGLLEDLPMLIWLAEEGAKDAIAVSPAAAADTESTDAAVPDWQALPPEQRRLLAAWAQTWPRLPETARRQLAANARVWLALDEAQRRRLAEDVAAWDALPASDRLAPRARFDAWQQLGPEGRATARAAAAWLVQAPADQQGAWFAEFTALPPERQARFLRDAATRDVFDTIDVAFPFVPESARLQTIALVRSLEPAARAGLREQARRMSPQQREALRQKLLAMSPEQRREAYR